MSKHLTNIHTHIFNGKCAPDYFFKVALPKSLDRWADEIKAFIEKPPIRWLIRKLSRKHGSSVFQRYLDFIEIGTQNSQNDIFRQLKESYSGIGAEMRFIALTLNMDRLDTLPSAHARIEDQIAEIERVRSFYPNNLFPFLSVDPRHLGGRTLVEWVKEKITRRAFFGIKLYPALGYFPFDPLLDELYQWAAENEVPVLTHCTRSGSHYTGRMMDVVPHNRPESLNSQSTAMLSIYARIDRFIANTYTWDESKYGCNIFSNPENYIPILEKYPNLKLCLAHFGGADEILKEDNAIISKGIDDRPDWFTRIQDMMGKYSNVYTDISYTLYHDKAMDAITTLLNRDIGPRILFGTDFYMTTREKPEDTLWQNCLQKINIQNFQKIAGINNDVYMRSSFYDPAINFT